MPAHRDRTFDLPQYIDATRVRTVRAPALSWEAEHVVRLDTHRIVEPLQPAEASTEIGADMPGRHVPEAERVANFYTGLVAILAVVFTLVHIGARLF